MNRTHDTHFFYCWDKMKQLEDFIPVAPKDFLEWLDNVNAVEEEGGFGAHVTYQEAIALYNEKKEEAEKDYEDCFTE